MEKVFCSECQHLIGSGSACRIPEYTEDHMGISKDYSWPYLKNENNDCNDFEPDTRGLTKKFFDVFRLRRQGEAF